MPQVRKFAFDVGWTLTSSAAILLVGFLLRVILARWLGADDLGSYTMIITIQGLAVFSATVGIPLALTKYVAQYKSERNILRSIISTAIIGSATIGLVFCILLYTLSGVLANIFDMPELENLLRILAFMFPFASIVETLLGLFNGLREMKIYAYLIIFRSFVQIILTVVLVWLGFGIEGVVLGIVLSVIASLLLGLYFARNYLRIYLRNFVQNMKRLLSFGSKVFGADALGMIVNYTDVIMIGIFLAARDVAYYGIAASLAAIFLIIPHAIQKITYPATSEYWSKNDRRSLNSMIDKSMKFSAFVLLPIGLGVWFFTEEIVTFMFGQEYIAAVLPLSIILIARVIRGATIVPIGLSFSGIGRPDIPLKLSGIAAVLNLVLNWLLIPPLGITGAAIATTISMLVAVGIFLALMPRILGVGIDVKWFARAFGSAGLALLLFIIAVQFLNPYAVGSVLLLGYIVFFFRTLITKDDKAVFGSFINSLIARR